MLLQAKPVNQVEARLMLMQAYETTFDIFDHIKHEAMDESVTDIDNRRPLASMAMHRAEDASSESRLYGTIELFSDRDVHKFFGLSLNEFLDLPHDICEHILTVCSNKQNRNNKATDMALSELSGKK